MPLYDPQRSASIDPRDAVAAVHAFLRRCRRWAEEETPRRIEKVAATRTPEDAAKLASWISYLEFTDHTLEELENGTLDDWFTDSAS